MNIIRILAEAKRVSQTSDHHSFSMGAVIFDKKGRIVSSRSNYLFKTHPEYRKLDEFKTLHAEAASILSIRHKIDLTGMSILVYRELKDGTLANAKPCDVCMKMINNYKLKEIWYTNDDGVSRIKL